MKFFLKCNICDKKHSISEEYSLYECDDYHIFCKKHLDKIFEIFEEDIVTEEIYRNNNYVPSDYCPICLKLEMKKVNEGLITKQHFIKKNIIEETICEEIKDKFSSLEEFYDYLEKFLISPYVL